MAERAVLQLLVVDLSTGKPLYWTESVLTHNDGKAGQVTSVSRATDFMRAVEDIVAVLPAADDRWPPTYRWIIKNYDRRLINRF